MAVGKFSYSFDRETFKGLHDTRQDAFKQALAKLPEQSDSPETIYVGKRVPVDAGTTGLAEMILGAMRRRLRDQVGAAASEPLMRVNEHQLAELDDAIDRVLREWLTKHELMPTQSKVIAISEHPVPQPRMNGAANGNGTGNGETREVRDLGSESTISLW
jgi:hypothetical protein